MPAGSPREHVHGTTLHKEILTVHSPIHLDERESPNHPLKVERLLRVVDPQPYLVHRLDGLVHRADFHSLIFEELFLTGH